MDTPATSIHPATSRATCQLRALWVPHCIVLNNSRALRLRHLPSGQRTAALRHLRSPPSGRRQRDLLGKEAETWASDGQGQELLLRVFPLIFLSLGFVHDRSSLPADASYVFDHISLFCCVLFGSFWFLAPLVSPTNSRRR